MALGSNSRGLARSVGQPALLGQRIVQVSWAAGFGLVPPKVTGLVGWGRKRTTLSLRQLAHRLKRPCFALEDGFLRSFGPGPTLPPLSLVVDEEGIYYDCNSPSALETLLEGANDALQRTQEPVGRLRELMGLHRMSKYNDAPPKPLQFCEWRKGRWKILLIDQTFGDLSVLYGGADATSFSEMLAAARAENPTATIYIKTHPEVSSGRKRGYLTHIQDDEHTVVLREPINPLSLIEQMDRVYVVTSTMGFEALLAGKPVTCFGVPWYAGWGVTDDRVKDSPAWSRRTRKRNVDELFAAAYIHYARYLNPETHQRGSIMDVIDWLVRQREMADRMHGPARKGRVIGVGFRRWKAVNLKPLLGLHPDKVQFRPAAKAARALNPQAGDSLVCWGATPPPSVAELARDKGARLLHTEDGFIRSVGLGSDFIAPRSIVLDERGIYFDASRPSDLEHILQNKKFSGEDLAEAQRVIDFIRAHGLTKYNLEPRDPPKWQVPAGRPIVVVPGQVEDDASIALGCTSIRTNLGLLQAARAARPDAYIVYKPHPDVASGNRRGRVQVAKALVFADHIETGVSIISCIEACDEVHTMTSLSGFDALIRGKKVVTYGQPFYAGWGLTEDCCMDGAAFKRRTRQLSLMELAAGALLHYPIYWDPTLKGYTTCMAVLRQIVAEREALEREGQLQHLRAGVFRRLARKASILVRNHIGSLSKIRRLG